MTDRNGVGWTNGTERQGTEPRVGANENLSDDDRPRSEFQLWHVHDTGGPEPCLKVRYCDDFEVPDWRGGLDLTTALREAEAQGWHAFDSEPGNADGEHSIVHLKRVVAR